MKLVIRIAGALIAVFIGVAVWFYLQGSAAPTTDVTAPPVETALSSSSDVTARVFEITDESSATFELDEELRGQPTHVTGVSNLVLGQISIDPDDLSTVEVGTILVNARGFTTGTGNRDRAVRGPILDTSVHEFIEFETVSIDGLAPSVAVGESVGFSMSGNLTIRDVTRPVTFSVTVTLTGPDRIEGQAVTEVTRSDFELVIPSVAQVANVTDEVVLTLDFVAVAA